MKVREKQDSFSSLEELDRELLEARRESIKKIEIDTEALAELHYHMNSLVHEQGEAIDSIEDNISSSTYDAEKAIEELIGAENKKNNSRFRWFLAGVSTGAAALIVAAIAIRKH